AGSQRRGDRRVPPHARAETDARNGVEQSGARAAGAKPDRRCDHRLPERLACRAGIRARALESRARAARRSTIRGGLGRIGLAPASARTLGPWSRAADAALEW